MISNEFRGIGRIISKSFDLKKLKNKDEDVLFFTVVINKGETPQYFDCVLFGKRIESMMKYGANNPMIDFRGEVRIAPKEYKGVKYKDFSININEFQLFECLDYKKINNINENNELSDYELLNDETINTYSNK